MLAHEAKLRKVGLNMLLRISCAIVFYLSASVNTMFIETEKHFLWLEMNNYSCFVSDKMN